MSLRTANQIWPFLNFSRIYVLQVEQLKCIKYIPIYYRIYTHIAVYNHLPRIRLWYILMALTQEMICFLTAGQGKKDSGNKKIYLRCVMIRIISKIMPLDSQNSLINFSQKNNSSSTTGRKIDWRDLQFLSNGAEPFSLRLSASKIHCDEGQTLEISYYFYFNSKETVVLRRWVSKNMKIWFHQKSW